MSVESRHFADRAVKESTQLLQSDHIEQVQKLSLFGALWRIGAELYVPVFAKHGVHTLEAFMCLNTEQLNSIVESNFRFRFDTETRNRLEKFLTNHSESVASLCNRATFRDLFHAQFITLIHAFLCILRIQFRLMHSTADTLLLVQMAGL